MLDGVGGDLVEDHPLDRHTRVEHLEQMPRDGLTLAILIGREIELVGLLQERLEVLDLVLLVGRHHVERLEMVLGVDAETRPLHTFICRRDLGRLRREIAHVADRRLDDELVAEEATDGPSLGR